jgi:hypothetical protein
MALVYSALGKPFHVPASKDERGKRQELREQGGTPEDLQKTPGAVANALNAIIGGKDTGARLGVVTNTEPAGDPNSPEEPADLVPDTRGILA